MPYPNFGKVKNIVLPFCFPNDDGITLDEYKERYGIDLKSLFNIELKEDYITIVLPENALILINPRNNKEDFPDSSAFSQTVLEEGLFVLNKIESSEWIEGSSNGDTSLGSVQTTIDASIGFEINKDEDFVIENLRIFLSGLNY